MFHIAASTPSPHLPTRGRVNDLIIRTLDTVAQWRSHRRDPLQILALDDHTLQDIGLGRADAIELADRAFRRS